MYVAMIILLIATATVAAQADLGLPLVQGDFYLYFLSLTVDIAGRRLLHRHGGLHRASHREPRA